MNGLLALWLSACGGPDARTEADGEPPIELKVMLEGSPTAGGGKLLLQAIYDPEGKVSLPQPEVPRLKFTPDGDPTQEKIGDRIVITQRYVFRGPSGNYEIPSLAASWAAGERTEEGRSSPVFVDIDAPPPREGELTDIVEPEPLERWPWLLLGSVGGLFLAGLLFAFRPRRAAKVAEAPPPPPHIAALQAWEAVRRDPKMTIDDKAQKVAHIFREYVEAVLGFEATSRTTQEILAHLESLVHLPQGNVPRAKRVLRAADRIKFAQDQPGRDWLEDLDADLRGFVESTRPSVGRTDGGAS